MAAVTAFAQDIKLEKLSGDSRPLNRWQNETISVQGVEPDEAGRCVVTCQPHTAKVRKLQDWGGRPILDFESGTPGKYTITVTMHGWSQTLHDALDELEVAAAKAELSDTDAADLQKAVESLTALVKELDSKYPHLKGTCVLEVADNDDPTPPPGKKEVVIIYRSSDLPKLPSEQRAMITSLTFREALSSRGHKFLVGLDDDSGVRDGKWAEWFEAVKGDPLPRVAFRPIGGGPIVDVDLPETKEELFKLLEGQQ